MSYPIIEDIQMPRDGRGRPAKYPFAQCGIGAGFVVPVGDRNPDDVQSALCTCAKRFLAEGMRFTTVRSPDRQSIFVKRIA